jgi:hypothetical protein
VGLVQELIAAVNGVGVVTKCSVVEVLYLVGGCVVSIVDVAVVDGIGNCYAVFVVVGTLYPLVYLVDNEYGDDGEERNVKEFGSGAVAGWL